MSLPATLQASTVSEALKSFRFFPRLPMEIQLNIWKYAIPPPQIVKIRFHETWIVDDDLNLCHRISFTSLTRPSSLLQACKCSRYAILRVYTACVKSNSSSGVLRLDGKNDTVLVTTRDFYSDISGPLYSLPRFHGVEKFALHASEFLGNSASQKEVLLYQLESIKTLTLLFSSNDAWERMKKSDDEPRIGTHEEDYESRVNRGYEAQPFEWEVSLVSACVKTSVLALETYMVENDKVDWNIPHVQLLFLKSSPQDRLYL